MANQNDGRPRLARHGAILTVGTDTYLNLPRNVEYEITWAQPERLIDASYNTGTPNDNTYTGDTNKGRFTIAIRNAMDVNDAASLISIFSGSTAGVQNSEDITFTILDYNGASTGESFAMTNCELAEDPVLRPGGGTEADLFRLVFEHDAAEPAASDYPGS